jgi:hypothetical protein
MFFELLETDAMVERGRRRGQVKNPAKDGRLKVNRKAKEDKSDENDRDHSGTDPRHPKSGKGGRKDG